MRLIIEGPDGAGKTTLVRQLADYFGSDILVMTEKGSKKLRDYEDKANLDNVISDRSFLSELVYTNVFERKSELSPCEYEALLNYYRAKGWVILVLDADSTCLANRLQLRGDEDEYKVRKISDLRMFYRAMAYFYDLPVIDAEHLDPMKLINDLEAGKYGKHNF